MARELKPIDISGVPDLVRIAEEVRTSNEPRLLRSDSEDIAVLMPVLRFGKKPRSSKTAADLAAFRASAGSWKDVDTDRFVADIHEGRRRSSRPPVDL